MGYKLIERRIGDPSDTTTTMCGWIDEFMAGRR
jgi:hypothetical protein